jgi:endonuclease/exonuclease/phosphatase (EEP) superfamily protein YafD
VALVRRSNQTAVGSGLKTFFGLALLTVGFLATLATILGFLGSLWWAFDILANYRLQYTLLLALTAALYGITFGRVTSLLFLAAAGLNVLVLLPLFTAAPAEAAGTETIQIVSYNSSAGAGDTDDFAAWLDAGQADLVFVLDTPEDWIGAVAADAGYQIQNSLPIDRRFGISLLAKQDIGVDLLRLDDQLREPALRIETAIEGRTVVIYAIQLTSPTSETGADRNARLLEEVKAAVASEVEPVVVIGDLSLTPWNSGFRSFLGDTGLENSLNGYGYQATWPADALPGAAIPYDHAFHSDVLTTADRSVGPGFGGPHRALLVEIGFAAGSLADG